MSCCGKAKSVLGTAAAIVEGTVKNAVGIKYEFTDDRIRTCHKCDEQTWMSRLEYAKWLKDNGIEVLKNFDELGKLPKLPKYILDKKRRNLYCRICKCFVPGKARVESEKCPLNKW